MKLLFKYGTIYREVLSTPKTDVCTLNKLMKANRTLINRLSLAVAEVIEDTMPGQIHECPYNASRLHHWAITILNLLFFAALYYHEQKHKCGLRSISFPDWRL